MRTLGYPILIEWDKFVPGTSIFIPCIERKKMEKFVRSEAERFHMEIMVRRVIERGAYGLRVWRV